jgi:hypothetical protein
VLVENSSKIFWEILTQPSQCKKNMVGGSYYIVEEVNLFLV